MATRDSTSNVVPLRAAEAPLLGMASTSATGRRLAGSRNEVWLCEGYTHAAQGIVLYVKPGLSTRAIMVEALAAIVGQCMGLPCPDPYIVTANPRHIGRPAGRKLVAFGSEQMGTSGTVFVVKNLDAMLQFMDKQKITEAVCAFDEFIGNGVRSPSDIVFNPSRGAAIIDHEDAMQASTRPDQAVTNWLAERVMQRTTADQRHLLLKKLRAKAQLAQDGQWDMVPAPVQFDQDGVPAYNQLLEFLRQRLVHLDRLLSTRVLPEQPYLSPHTNDHAAGGTTDI